MSPLKGDVVEVRGGARRTRPSNSNDKKGDKAGAPSGRRPSHLNKYNGDANSRCSANSIASSGAWIHNGTARNDSSDSANCKRRNSGALSNVRIKRDSVLPNSVRNKLDSLGNANSGGSNNVSKRYVSLGNARSAHSSSSDNSLKQTVTGNNAAALTHGSNETAEIAPITIATTIGVSATGSTSNNSA